MIEKKIQNNTLFIIIPAYNEEANLASVIDDWYPIVEKYNGDGKSRLIIIDDGSTDNSSEVVNKYINEKKYLELIRKENSGHGGTIYFGYCYAIEHGADYIFQTDSDRQTLSCEFGSFWEVKDHYDMILGKRSQREDGITRICVTKVLKLILKIIFGVCVADANVPYRLMRANALSQCMQYVPEGYHLTNVVISTVAIKKHLKVMWLPITFRRRREGINSINLKKIFKIGMSSIADFVKINLYINKGV